ncbi:vesicle coat protein [Lithospermum erythrorhizon]|uniref:Vesicle coat protein n=1 Tax=Lithospermum erythrorhizon TaxID=34254 RepID=A0AAV3NNB1_LITER
MESFRRAYGALKDSTKVGLAKVNSEFKELDIAIVKATNHVESPPKERHVRKIFFATSAACPRADVAYSIHALSRRLAKTKNWIVAMKTLIVFHRTLREGDPTFIEELLRYSERQIFQVSNFKDDSSNLAWDCSAFVRAYALFLEERLDCFRILKYDIDAEKMTKVSQDGSQTHQRTRNMSEEELLEQLPALQRLLFRIIGCRAEGAACFNYLIQYALSLVLKESFKVYCAVNDGIINLVDMFFEMSKHDAIKALDVYRKAGQQAENLADFYDCCKSLDLARTFQFPKLRQPPHSFLATMEEYIKEASQMGSNSSKKIEYKDTEEDEPSELEEPSPKETQKQEEEVEVEEDVEPEEEPEPKKEEVEEPTLISTEEPADLLGLNEVNPLAKEIEDNNAFALAIIQPGEASSTNNQLSDIGKTSGWELALVSTPSNHTQTQATDKKMAGGFDKLLLDSLYEDDATRRQYQMQNAGYGYEMAAPNSSYHYDPFAMSNNAAPTNVQMAMMSQQQMIFQQQQHQMMFHQQHNNHNMMMVPHHQYQASPYTQTHQMMLQMLSANPFSSDPFGYPQSRPPNGNHTLL